MVLLSESESESPSLCFSPKFESLSQALSLRGSGSLGRPVTRRPLPPGSGLVCVKAKDDKRLGVDSDLVRTPSYMTMLNRRLQVAERLLFLTVLPMAMFEEPRHYLRRVSNYVMIGMLFIVARTCCFAGLKGLRESFLAYQVWCHHSKYSTIPRNENRHF